jgi:putative sterol carrier protein
VVGFEFSDVAKGKRHWWLVSEDSAVDLCVKDPGYEVDLFVHSDVRTMTAVWIGSMRLAQAMQSGRLEVDGPRQLRAKFGSWLNLSSFAPIKDQTARTAGGW